MAAPKLGATVYGVVKSGNSYSVVAVTLGSPVSLETKKSLSSSSTYAGAVFASGRMYLLWELFGMVFTSDIYDMSTWNVVGSGPSMTSAFGSVCLTYSPAEAKAYGCFTSGGGSSYDFCSFDLTATTSSVIAALPCRIVAMAADNGGNIYGVGVDGNLYSINPATGASTVIGPTGIATDASMQSASYDNDNSQMYWASGSNIYVVDTTTGAAELISSVADYGISAWYGMHVVSADAPTSTPGWVTDFTLSFDRDALTGTATFGMPVTDTQGANITGDLTYHLLVDNEDVASASAAPGEKILLPLTVSEGTHTFKAYASNGDVNGMDLFQTRFVGHDVPCTPANVTVTENNGVTISWDPVSAGVNSGYINADNITYNVVRNPGAVTIASGLTQTTVADTKLNSMGFYTYEITATDGVKTSSVAQSQRMLLGSELGIMPPYKYEFDEEGGFGIFTQVDANNDGYKWAYDENYDLVWCIINPGQASDDWLISPPINLSEGMNYNLQLDVVASSRMETERIEVRYGTSPDPAQMTHYIVNPMRFSVRTNINTWFAPEVSGKLYIGFHVITDATDGAISLSRFEISTGFDSNSPAAVTQPKVEAAPMGALSADVSFYCPMKTFSGDDLTEIEKVVITNTVSGKVYEVTDVAPGKSVVFTDTEPADGQNTYTIAAYNSAGGGKVTEVSAWVGLDIPGTPKNVQWQQIGPNSVFVTWEPPVDGQHGGYVDFSNIKYAVVVPEADQVITQDWDDTSLELADFSMAKEQDILSFGVAAVNDKGVGLASRSNQSAFGTPLAVPFYESFEMASLHSYPWLMKQVNGYNACNVLTDIYGVDVTSYDDNGMVVFTALSQGRTRLELPILDISTLEAPALKFWINFIGDIPEFVITASTSSGITWEDIVEVPNVGYTAGWHLVTVPLDKFKGMNNVQLGFEIRVTDEHPSYYGYVLVDKISVDHNPACDLMISAMKVPEKAQAGSSFNMSLTVTNAGSREISNYAVNVKVNDQLVKTEQHPALAPDGVAVLNIEVPLSSNATSLNLVVSADCEGDENPDNNIWGSTYTQVIRSRFPRPVSLSNVSTDNSRIELVWTEPEAKYQATITDDLESYEHGSVGGIDQAFDPSIKDVVVVSSEGQIGDYKVIDNDGMPTLTVMALVGQLPHEHDGMACQVIDLDKIPGLSGFSNLWSAHSGSTLFCFWQSFKVIDGVESYDLPNDDYLILPKLAEDDPRISFWAKSLTGKDGLESFEIMVSMDGNNLSDFVAYQSVVNVPAGYSTDPEHGYTFYEFELPEGTQYVAIRYNAAGSTALLIDDITFTPESNYQDLTLEGYNVYRNNERINDALVAENLFTDTPAEEDNFLYNVTAVYTEGESRYSNTVRVSDYTAAITEIEADGNKQIYVRDRSIVIKGFAGETASLFSIDGKLLRQLVAEDETEIASAPGMYVVRVGGRAQSIVVK